ncbi:heme-binding protein [Alcaligenaceae bacterium]|nr:heme-binding protein [Alcaligenaceae bacterium]
MKSKPVLSLTDVQTILAAAAQHAVTHQWAVTISVVDDGGHLLGLTRLDGAAPISAQISPAKARSAALGQRETKSYEDIINQGRTAFLSAPGLDGMLEGGVPIIVEGQVVGAVGVSGVKSNEDVDIARAGIAALQA